MLDAPNGKIKLDANRQAIGTNFVTEVVNDDKGDLVSKVVKVIPNVNQRLGYSGGVRQVRSAGTRQSALQKIVRVTCKDPKKLSAAHRAAEMSALSCLGQRTLRLPKVGCTSGIGGICQVPMTGMVVSRLMTTSMTVGMLERIASR